MLTFLLKTSSNVVYIPSVVVGRCEVIRLLHSYARNVATWVVILGVASMTTKEAGGPAKCIFSLCLPPLCISPALGK